VFYSIKHVLYHKWQLFPCKRVVKSINIIYTLCTLFYKNAIEKTLYKIDKWIMSIEIIQWNTKWFIILVMYCKTLFHHVIWSPFVLLSGHLISLDISKCYIQKIKFLLFYNQTTQFYLAIIFCIGINWGKRISSERIVCKDNISGQT